MCVCVSVLEEMKKTLNEVFQCICLNIIGKVSPVSLSCTLLSALLLCMIHFRLILLTR